VQISIEYYIRCSNECGNEFASFPQTLRYARNCSATWKSTIRKCFLIQTSCLMCIAIGTTVEEVNVCHLRKRVAFGLHHESNTSTHFNCSELSTTSDGLHGTVVCSRDTATHYSLDMSYCIPFRTLSITHSSLFLVDHSISRVSIQQWISRNLFTFGPMLIGTFLLNLLAPELFFFLILAHLYIKCE